MIISFHLNGKFITISSDPDKQSVELLKDELDCHSLNHRCQTATCGACMIMINNKIALSCILPAFALKTSKVWTMEGLAKQEGYADILDGYAKAEACPCPVCAPSRALITEYLISQTMEPSQKDIRQAIFAVTCGCMSTKKMENAIRHAIVARRRRLDE